MRPLIAVALVIVTGVLSASAADNQCLIVRSAEGHRFRDSMIAGALTGGIGFAAGAAFGGAKYEYVDSFNLTGTKLKYKGAELQKLQQAGVHVVVINKKATSDETQSARASCTAPTTPPAPAVVPVSAPVQNAPTQQPTVQPAVSQTSIYQEQSLGDAAQQARTQKEQQQQQSQQQQPPQ